MTNNMEDLYGWLFHYNPYMKHWAVFKKEDMGNYFNGKLKDVLISSKVDTLIEIVINTQGDPDKVKALLNE
jgi:hypothetical protein